jgi:hypothetical protein
LGLASYDTVAIPGGAFAISPSQDGTDGEAVIQMIEALRGLHNPRQIIVISHQDCGRYQIRFATQLRDPSFDLAARQEDDLRVALSRLEGRFPEVLVRAYFASNDSEGIVTFRMASA